MADYHDKVESNRGQASVDVAYGILSITVWRYAADVSTMALLPAQARELASMLIAGADIQDELLARPAINEIPLQYEHRADTSKGEGE